MGKERRVVPYRKPAKKPVAGGDPPQAPTPDAGEIVALPVASVPPSSVSLAGLLSPAVAGLLTAAAVGAAVGLWRFGYQSLGGAASMRLGIGLGAAVLFGGSTVAAGRRFSWPGPGVFATIGGLALAALPWFGWSTAERDRTQADLVLGPALRDVSFAALDASMGFGWREKANKLPLAERPLPADPSRPWQAWAAEISTLRPPAWASWDRGVVVAWSAGPTYGVHPLHVLLPDGLRARTEGEIAWVVMIQTDPLPDGERADVRVLDRRGTRVVATGTREDDGPIAASDLLPLVVDAVCGGYRDACPRG